MILKSSHSAFAGFLRDEYTTLPETRDRLLATSLTATLAVSQPPMSTSARPGARCGTTLLEAFAEHDSQSVQHTLYAMGQAVLDSVDGCHGDPARDAEQASSAGRPLARSGLENRNEIFVPTDEPLRADRGHARSR